MDTSTDPVVSAATAAEARCLLPQLLQHLPAAEQTQKLHWLLEKLESLPPHAALSMAVRPTDSGITEVDQTSESTEQASALDYLSGLLVARTVHTAPARAVVWVHPAPGRTALVAAPLALQGSAEQLTTSADPVELLWQTRLLQQAARWAESFGAEMLQAVAPPEDETFQWALTQAGIPKLVDLVFVTSPPLSRPDARSPITRSRETRSPETEPDRPCGTGSGGPRQQFLSVPPDGDRLQRWYRLLEATYVDSLDCPAINGQRSLVHTVAGYQATGQRWDPGWVILTSDPPTDLGGFILADHPAADFFELIYFGVVPQARGCGLGGKILQQALSLAAQAGRSRLIAAVDRQNLPALRVYAAADFTALEQRTVFARFFTLKSHTLDTPTKIR
jgi:GNAT superfamily N-acetyltransferase